jgi:hypothetical protein
MPVDFSRDFEAALFRALGQFDLNPRSATFGCGDRSYWHYLDQKGFSVASFQVAMLGFQGGALLLPNQADIFKNAARAALEWWKRSVLSGRTIDEYFLGQKSFCATAYTTMAAAILHKTIFRDDRELESAVRTALALLEKNRMRPQSANQTLAARLAFDLSGAGSRNPFRPPTDRETGFFLEYGGIDLGYTLKCVDLVLLALFVLKEPERKKEYLSDLAQILKALKLLAEFRFHPALGSRGNGHRLIGGLSTLAHLNSEVRRIYDSLSDPKLYGDLVPPQHADDKYLCFFHVNDLLLGVAREKSLAPLFTLDRADEDSIRAMKFEAPRSFVALKSLGIYLFSNPNEKLCVSVQQGGGYTHSTGSDPPSLHQGAVYTIEGETFHSCVDLRGKERVADGELRIPIGVTALKQKAKLVQSPWFGCLFKLLFSIPGIAHILRYFIYSENSLKRSVRTIGQRRFTLTEDRLAIADEHHAGVSPSATFSGWSMTDGHSTRLWGKPNHVFLEK